MLSEKRESADRYLAGKGAPTSVLAHALLKESFGPGAEFRAGQLESITALVDDRARLLVVQRTGWGKSLVYFLATRLLRDRGAGPTVLVSPLLSLMRNQQQMAERLGLVAETINSANSAEWGDVLQRLNDLDLLIISPERLANPQFQERVLSQVANGIGMIVVDEAHCISEWGHDFRPDYRRLVQFVKTMPVSVPLLAATATANDRVIDDIGEQIGERLRIQRGALARESIRLQTLELASKAQRLAWMANRLPELAGPGIIYCLTKNDANQVSAFLKELGFAAPAYHEGIGPDERVALENKLIENQVKALCATVALGMGFDKPDLGFVIHYQRPSSVIAYYQQIGRAGRATQNAYAMLLTGHEDDSFHSYIRTTGSLSPRELKEVLKALEESGGLQKGVIAQRVNLSIQRIDLCLKTLEVDGAIIQERGVWKRTVTEWVPDIERWQRRKAQQELEARKMKEFVHTRECLMEFVTRQLDDPGAQPCGRCAICSGDVLARTFTDEHLRQAERFLNQLWTTIEPIRQLPNDVLPERSEREVCPESILEPGLALCTYRAGDLGALVHTGKYRSHRFHDKLVAEAASAIRERWPIDQSWWIAPVPSRREPDLVRDFAERLALNLGIQCVDALLKIRDTTEQKTMENENQQVENLRRVFQANPSMVRPNPTLLVDDLVDSRWTLTFCGAVLRRHGSGPVYPFALASVGKLNSR